MDCHLLGFQVVEDERTSIRRPDTSLLFGRLLVLQNHRPSLHNLSSLISRELLDVFPSLMTNM